MALLTAVKDDPVERADELVGVVQDKLQPVEIFAKLHVRLGTVDLI